MRPHARTGNSDAASPNRFPMTWIGDHGRKQPHASCVHARPRVSPPHTHHSRRMGPARPCCRRPCAAQRRPRRPKPPAPPSALGPIELREPAGVDLGFDARAAPGIERPANDIERHEPRSRASRSMRERYRKAVGEEGPGKPSRPASRSPESSARERSYRLTEIGAAAQRVRTRPAPRRMTAASR